MLSDMPPSTATKRTLAVGQVDVLDRFDRVERHARRSATSARPGSIESSLPGPSSSSAVRRIVVHVLGDRRRAAVRRVGHREAAAEVVGGEVAEGGERLDREPPRLEVEELRADVHVQAACRSAQGACCSRSIAIRRLRRCEKPNFEPAWPVRIAAWVSATTPGRDADHHLGAGVASRSSLSSSSKLSTTIRAPISAAARSSCSDFALPWKTIRSPVEARALRQRELAAGGDVDAQALLAGRRAGPRCTGRPWRRRRPRRRPSRP